MAVVAFFRLYSALAATKIKLRNSACYGSDYEECRSLQVSHARYQSGDCLHLHRGER